MKQLTPDAITTTKVVKLKDISEHPDNVRRGDVEAIVDSLNTHGQYRPLIVQASTMFVCAGNHTLKAARRLSWEKIAVTILDIDDDQARRILAVDNRAADNATYDYDGLSNLLASFADSDAGLAGTGYDEMDLDDLVARSQETSLEALSAPTSDDPTDSLPHITDDTGNQYKSENLDGYRQKYEQTTVRSVVLHYAGDQFVWVTDKLAAVRKDLELDSNTDAVLAVLEERFGETAPEPPADA